MYNNIVVTKTSKSYCPWASIFQVPGALFPLFCIRDKQTQLRDQCCWILLCCCLFSDFWCSELDFKSKVKCVALTEYLGTTFSTPITTICNYSNVLIMSVFIKRTKALPCCNPAGSIINQNYGKNSTLNYLQSFKRASC